MSLARVLIVEDDQVLREALSDTLELAGYPVSTAIDGSDAINVLEEQDISMVVSDVQMQPMDGHTLLKQIKERHADIPVILITAYLSDEDIKKESLHDIADGFLRKPFRVEKIVELLNSLAPLRSREPL